MKLNEFITFMSYLETIIYKQKQLEKGIKAFFGTNTEINTDTYQAQDYYIRLLEHIFDDYEGWIYYFVYENDFGKNNLKVIINNQLYDLSTQESLYNLLIMNKEKNNE